MNGKLDNGRLTHGPILLRYATRLEWRAITAIGLDKSIRRGRHVVYLLHAHVVFVTKRRGKVFDAEHLRYLEQVFARVCAAAGAELAEFNGETDHIHLLIHFRPTVRLADLVNSLKGVSSRKLKQQFPSVATFRSVRRSRGALWSPSYFVGSVGGAPLDVLKRYIENQDRPK